MTAPDPAPFPDASLEELERLRWVLDALPVRVFWKDREYRYLGCNQAFLDDAGLASLDELVGRNDFELAWRELAAQYRADDIAVVEEGRTKIGLEEPLPRADGRLRRVRTGKRPLLDRAGQVVGVLGWYVDVSDQREVEDQLRDVERRYQTMFDSAQEGIFVSDSSGRYVSVNPAGAAMLGYRPDEILGLTLLDLTPEEDRAQLAQRIDLLREQKALVAERRLRRKDGGTLPVEISGQVLPGGDLLGVVRDISWRKRAEAEQARLEEELRHARKLETMGRLAGGVAHDFNNILTVILNCVHVAGIHAARGSDASEELREIRAACDRATALTRQLLAFGSKKLDEAAQVDLNDVVAQAGGMLQRVVGADVSIELELAPDVPLVRAERDYVEQVILNLAVNARDAMEGGGRLSLRTRAAPAGTHPAGDRVEPPALAGACPWGVLVVEDTGKGMDAETLARVFEPFFTTKDPGKGTGLGLATVLGIVGRRRGACAITTAVGRGTRFEVWLPVSGAEPPGVVPGPPPAPPAATRGSATILVAEDSAAVRGILVQTLRAGGHTVHAAATGDSLLAIAEELESVDALVTDVVMPGMSGVALAERLRQRWPALGVVLVSGYSESLLKDGASLGPLTQFVEKPFSPEDLEAAMAAVLAAVRARS